jgi:hypothetical protein
MGRFADANDDGTVKGLSFDGLDPVTESDVVFGQVPEQRWRRIGDPHQFTDGSGFEGGELAGGRLHHLSVPGGDGIAMRIAFAFTAERRRDSVEEFVGDHVFENLCLLVNLIPPIAQRLDEIELDDPVATHHAEG